MTHRDPELVARLEVAAKAAIAKALAESPLPAEATLEDIERAALAAGTQIQQAIAAELAQESAAVLPDWPSCPQCGQKMKTKGKRRRRLVTQAGEVEIERLYYHCRACGQGFFPPGPALGSEGGQQL
jgi:NADH pyrophosphatase NudC (nudix superfamily)